MLLIIGVLIMAIVAAILSRLPLPEAVDPAHLGHVSQRWLAEYRATHPT
jgi:hypothetical protein